MPIRNGRPFSTTSPATCPADFLGKMADYKRGLIVLKPTLNVATRKSSEMTLGIINSALLPNSLGGSADLTHSNLTLTKGQGSLTAEDFHGSYVRYGIREFGMSAAMNGVAAAWRLRALWAVRSSSSPLRPRRDPALGADGYTGDLCVYRPFSIGVGEDGPTHEPVEQLASAARPAASQRLSPGRRGGMRGMLGTGAGSSTSALGAARCRGRTCRRCPAPSQRRYLSARGAYVLKLAR